MKKILIVVFAAALAAACSSNKSNVKTADGRNSANAKNAKYQIIDQEFDNLLAPEADYDTLPAYELQACGDSYLPPAEVKLKKTAKPAKKTVAKKSATENTTNKKVVNVVNIIETDGPVPALPTAHSSSTTTTTYTNGYQQ